METTIQKWGNSLAVRLPRSITQQCSLHVGDRVAVRGVGSGVSIRHIRQSDFTLEELVNKITPRNIHKKLEWGEPRGRELW